MKNARYLVVSVDKHGLVSRQDCPGNSWRMEGLNTGKTLPDNLQSIAESAADFTTPQLYPYVQLTDTLVADVHVLNRGDEKQLILHDVSGVHDHEHKLQQKAHEVSLLLDQQAELINKLADKRREAEQASKAKSRFIASMSHEFRSPITSIMGYAELLNGSQPGSRAPAAIQRASWHLLTLVENLLEQARMGEGILELNLTPVDVTQVIDDMRELFTIQAGSRGLELHVECAADLQPLISDELRLRQVLINLISNAIRYTDKGLVRLSCTINEGAVRFQVEDTGKGIAEEDIERVFKAFTRLNPEGESGAGLGLSISQQLVEALGGKLELDSAPGKGSTFSFDLPQTPVGTAAPGGSLAGISILLVEDDDDLRAMYEIFLEDWGMQVTSVPGYRRAVEAFRNNPTDLIMTDLYLADGNGVELLAELRPLKPGTAAILCSGSGAVEGGFPDDPDCADAFIVKPIAAEHLRSIIFATIRNTKKP